MDRGEGSSDLAPKNATDWLCMKCAEASLDKRFRCYEDVTLAQDNEPGRIHSGLPRLFSV